jgi:hypothetical protein
VIERLHGWSAAMVIVSTPIALAWQIFEPSRGPLLVQALFCMVFIAASAAASSRGVSTKIRGSVNARSRSGPPN